MPTSLATLRSRVQRWRHWIDSSARTTPCQSILIWFQLVRLLYTDGDWRLGFSFDEGGEFIAGLWDDSLDLWYHIPIFNLYSNYSGINSTHARAILSCNHTHLLDGSASSDSLVAEIQLIPRASHLPSLAIIRIAYTHRSFGPIHVAKTAVFDLPQFPMARIRPTRKCFQPYSSNAGLRRGKIDGHLKSARIGCCSRLESITWIM